MSTRVHPAPHAAGQHRCSLLADAPRQWRKRRRLRPGMRPLSRSLTWDRHHVQQRGRPRQNRTRGECENDGQAVAHPAWITRIRYLGQPLQKARDLPGYDLGVLAEGQGQAGSAMMRRQARSSTRITGRRELHDLGSRACHVPGPVADLTDHHEPGATRLRRSPGVAVAGQQHDGAGPRPEGAANCGVVAARCLSCFGLPTQWQAHGIGCEGVITGASGNVLQRNGPGCCSSIRIARVHEAVGNVVLVHSAPHSRRANRAIYRKANRLPCVKIGFRTCHHYCGAMRASTVIAALVPAAFVSAARRPIRSQSHPAHTGIRPLDRIGDGVGGREDVENYSKCARRNHGDGVQPGPTH